MLTKMSEVEDLEDCAQPPTYKSEENEAQRGMKGFLAKTASQQQGRPPAAPAGSVLALWFWATLGEKGKKSLA